MDAPQGVVRLGEVRLRHGKPAFAGRGVGRDRGEGLAELVGDRGGKLAHGEDTVRVRELRARLVQAALAFDQPFFRRLLLRRVYDDAYVLDDSACVVEHRSSHAANATHASVARPNAAFHVEGRLLGDRAVKRLLPARPVLDVQTGHHVLHWRYVIGDVEAEDAE